MRGYKVFNEDWTCRDFQYEVGKTFEEDVKPRTCDAGFHFCKELTACFRYYTFNPNNKVAEVTAHGDVAEGDGKYCTNKIEIDRELSWYEVLNMVNAGVGCTGLDNVGDSNTGSHNTGHGNTGHGNTGCNNSGDCNSGHYNSGDYNTGCFNTKTGVIRFFDKDSDMTPIEWRDSRAYAVLHIMECRYSERPGEDRAEYVTKWWGNLSDEDKEAIRGIPNYDEDKFFAILGIKKGE